MYDDKGTLEPLDDEETNKLRDTVAANNNEEANKLCERIFTVGETVKVKEGYFRITKLMRGRMVLKAVPKV